MKVENIAVYVSLSNTVAMTVKKQWMYRHVHTPQILKKVLNICMGCLYHHSWLLLLNELSCLDKAISVLPYPRWSAHLISAITLHHLCFLYCRSVMYRNIECCTVVPKWFFSQLNMCCRLCLGGGRLVWGGHGAAKPIAVWIESTEYGEYLQCYKHNATHGVNSCCLVINLFVLWCFCT